MQKSYSSEYPNGATKFRVLVRKSTLSKVLCVVVALEVLQTLLALSLSLVSVRWVPVSFAPFKSKHHA